MGITSLDVAPSGAAGTGAVDGPGIPGLRIDLPVILQLHDLFMREIFTTAVSIILLLYLGVVLWMLFRSNAEPGMLLIQILLWTLNFALGWCGSASMPWRPAAASIITITPSSCSAAAQLHHDQHQQAQSPADRSA
jgi:hypothetical protein